MCDPFLPVIKIKFSSLVVKNILNVKQFRNFSPLTRRGKDISGPEHFVMFSLSIPYGQQLCRVKIWTACLKMGMQCGVPWSVPWSVPTQILMQVVIRGRLMINAPLSPPTQASPCLPVISFQTKFTLGVFQSFCVKWQGIIYQFCCCWCCCCCCCFPPSYLKAMWQWVWIFNE